MPADSRSNDRWFQHVAIIVRDMDAAYARLREHRVRHASTGPQRLPDWNPNAGGIQAFYFKDPDGHPLEILAFPAGQGRPAVAASRGPALPRHRPHGDRRGRHGASLASIGTARDAGRRRERELRRRAGAPEQRLRRPPADHGAAGGAGPGIEFLEYLAPSDGRPRPPDVRSNDLVAWQTELRVRDARVAEKALAAARAGFVSPGPVAVPSSVLGFSRALLAADPDGHLLQLVQ